MILKNPPSLGGKNQQWIIFCDYHVYSFTREIQEYDILFLRQRLQEQNVFMSKNGSSLLCGLQEVRGEKLQQHWRT